MERDTEHTHIIKISLLNNITVDANMHFLSARK